MAAVKENHQKTLTQSSASFCSFDHVNSELLLTNEINGYHLLHRAAVQVGDAHVHEGHVEGREYDEAAREARLLPPIVETDDDVGMHR